MNKKKTDILYNLQAKIRMKANDVMGIIFMVGCVASVIISIETFLGIMKNVTPETTMFLSGIMILLAAVQVICNRKMPQKKLVIYISMAILCVDTFCLVLEGADLRLIFLALPILSIMYCDKWIYWISCVVNCVLIGICTWMDAPSELAYQTVYEKPMGVFLGTFIGYAIECVVMAFLGHAVLATITNLLASVQEGADHAEELRKAQEEELRLLGSLAEVNLSAHVLNLDRDETRPLKTTKDIARYTEHVPAREALRAAMLNLTTEAYLDEVLEFVDLWTLPRRMKDKRIISKEFVGKINGWCKCSFIAVSRNEKGEVNEVLYTVQVIDEEKREMEKLRKLGRTDAMTALGNRYAYENFLRDNMDKQLDDEFTVIILDLDNLKLANDTLGHNAGDELIVAASEIIRHSFGPDANCYRIGGDEFCVITTAEQQEIADACGKVEKYSSEWKGELNASISLSYGYASFYENRDTGIRGLGEIADARMYEMKKQHHIGKLYI